MTDMHSVLDLDRYPLDRPGSPGWQAMVDTAREDLARDGMFNLPGFLRPEAREATLRDTAPRFATQAFTYARRHNIYFKREIPGLPDDHPALRMVDTVNHTLCGDQLTGPVADLYHWPAFAGFLAATMDKPALYPMDDALSCFNVMAYYAGEGLNWHFDRSEFTTTLLLQAPQQGGAFEYRSDLRSDDDPNYDGVAALLTGQDPQQRRLDLAPGTLNVFRGKNTAHRVTPVQGDRPRVIAVFSYYERPGMRFTPEEQLGFYGRTG